MRRLAPSALLLIAVAAGACNPPQDPVARGDALWADSQFSEAAAEYRLAARRARADAGIRLRLAHAYAQSLRSDRAVASYTALLRDAPERQEQATFDLVRLGRAAQRQGNWQALSEAAAGVLAIRPEQPLPHLHHALARQALQGGNREQAMAFLEGALATAPPDSLAALWLLAGRVREDLGACDAARRFYNRYLEHIASGEVADDVRWRLGNCAFSTARDYARAGMPRQALERFGSVVALGTPRNLVDQAWLERGELFRDLGQSDSAAFAYTRVLEMGSARAAPQVLRRAADRLREMGLEPELWLPAPADLDSTPGVAGTS